MQKIIFAVSILICGTSFADDDIVVPADEVCGNEAKRYAEKLILIQNFKDDNQVKIDRVMSEREFTACYKAHQELGAQHFSDLGKKYFELYQAQIKRQIKTAQEEKPAVYSARICVLLDNIKSLKQDIKNAYKLARDSGGNVINMSEIEGYQNGIEGSQDDIAEYRKMAASEHLKISPCNDATVKKMITQLE